MRILKLILLFLFSALYAEEEVLKVGMELTYPPFEMIDPEGAPAGYSVDMAHALGKFLNKKIIIENIPFIGLIPALHCGKIDLIISSMSVTEERKGSIDFSEPYLKTGLSMLLSIHSTIQDVQEANHPECHLVVKQSTTGKIYAEKNLPKAQLLVLEKESSCVLEVLQGKADGFIYDQFSVYTYWKKHPLTTRALLKPFAIEEWAIGVRKGDSALLQGVNQFIQQFQAEGGFEKLNDRYLHEQKQAAL